MSNATIVADCLQCASDIALPSGVEVGEILACHDCGQEHEVLELTPTVRLDLAPEVEEDWGE